MPTLFHHEIESYKVELERLKSDKQELTKPGAVQNLTHAMLAASNRMHQMVVGLCSLVEVCLLELALANAGKSPIKLSDVRGQGISRLQVFLSSLGIIDFGTLKSWEEFFYGAYKLRNSFVHSYGGMIVDAPNSELLKCLEKLCLTIDDNILVGARRIRLDFAALEKILVIVDSLLKELGAYDETTQST